MGYRCPECKAEYGFDDLAFRAHALDKHGVDVTDDLEPYLWAQRIRFDREERDLPVMEGEIGFHNPSGMAHWYHKAACAKANADLGKVDYRGVEQRAARQAHNLEEA